MRKILILDSTLREGEQAPLVHFNESQALQLAKKIDQAGVDFIEVAPSGNYGEKHALFEPVHGSAPKYAGLDVVNPTGMLLSAAMMLEHIGEKSAAQKLNAAIRNCYGQKVTTRDVGGTAKTSEMVEKIISMLD
ncbi:hypothetical protein FJZ26_04895, partial [Candidatus Parvarchaeota archaeon]|nr:hypothetical protein [Candidatus Parvarchaeota archaeon]